MNPEDSFDYQTIDMDWHSKTVLYGFIWMLIICNGLFGRIGAGIEEKGYWIYFFYPEYLNQRHEDDIDATPRSFERVGL